MKFTLDVPNKALAAIAIGGIAFAAGRVVATSFPADGQQMYYSGFVADESGAPQTGVEDITVALFNASSGGTRLCEANEDGVDLAPSLGRFRVALPSACSSAVRDNGDVYAQVTVGATTLPRQKLGAAPYAVSARDAQSADFATEATNAASAASVAANGVSRDALQGKVVDASKIADGGVGTVALADGSVTGLKLSADLRSRMDDLESGLAEIDEPTEADRRYLLATIAPQSRTVGEVLPVDFTALDSDTAFSSDFDLSSNRFQPGRAGVYAVTVSIASDNWKSGGPRLSLNCTSGTTPHHNWVVQGPAVASDS